MMFRNPKQMERRMAFAVAIGLFASAAAWAGKPDKPGGGGGKPGTAGYTLVALPDELGGTDLNGYAEGLQEVRDESGELVGVEVVGMLGGRAHHWQVDASGAIVGTSELPLPAGADPETTFSTAQDINQGGLVVGCARPSGALRPLVWLDPLNPDSTPIELPVPSGFAGSARAININNHGLVVGWLRASDGIEYVVAWGIKPDGTVVGPEVIGLGDAGAPDVNDAGTVVATVNHQAQRWQVDWNGETLSVSPPEILTAEMVDEKGDAETITLPRVAGINEYGDVCGTYRPVPDGSYEAYLLTAEGVLIEMPKLVDNKRRGTANYQASDLNDAAELQSVEVVGAALIYDKRTNVVVDDTQAVWQGDNATDLQASTDQPDSQLWLVDFAVVSDSGWLAGFGWDSNDDPKAIVLVPE